MAHGLTVIVFIIAPISLLNTSPGARPGARPGMPSLEVNIQGGRVLFSKALLFRQYKIFDQIIYIILIKRSRFEMATKVTPSSLSSEGF